MFSSGAEDESLWYSSPCLVVSEGVRIHASTWWDQTLNSLCYMAVFLQRFKRLLSFPNSCQREELRRFLCLFTAAHPRMHGVLCRRWENVCSDSTNICGFSKCVSRVFGGTEISANLLIEIFHIMRWGYGTTQKSEFRVPTWHPYSATPHYWLCIELCVRIDFKNLTKLYVYKLLFSVVRNIFLTVTFS